MTGSRTPGAKGVSARLSVCKYNPASFKTLRSAAALYAPPPLFPYANDCLFLFPISRPVRNLLHRFCGTLKKVTPWKWRDERLIVCRKSFVSNAPVRIRINYIRSFAFKKINATTTATNITTARFLINVDLIPRTPVIYFINSVSYFDNHSLLSNPQEVSGFRPTQ